MENEINLYIPIGVKAENELFNGLGKREFISNAKTYKIMMIKYIPGA